MLRGPLFFTILVAVALLWLRGEPVAKSAPESSPHSEAKEPRMSGAPLQVGFSEACIDPKLGKKPVYLAGFGNNRKATAIHDSLFARAVVLKFGAKKLALVSVDLIGFFYEPVQQVREGLTDFDYVLVSSTHSHDGPDTLGIWGPTPFQSGVDTDYLDHVQKQIVRSIRQAERVLKPCTVRIGKARDETLLSDSRLPVLKHDELVALKFEAVDTKRTLGVLVQWNCHPETMGRANTEVSSDYVGSTVHWLEKKHACPVAYFTGTVGGLMSSLGVEMRDEQGKRLDDGSWEKTERYGVLLAQLADQALRRAEPLAVDSLTVRRRQLYLPVDNQLYLAARTAGVMRRSAYLWSGTVDRADPLPDNEFGKRACIQTELAVIQLGELEIAALPGEIYPELVLDKVQDPADPAADFPDAPIEPAVYPALKAKHRMLFGLANDEIGYIIPKRQWDERTPFCYQLKKTQYGEINSLGPDTAPLLMKAFVELMK